ncbi:MAG: BON domain-containing protein [Verrucomicrobiae bacterium]|nr:BON domain-containing protein [Verrucomicrobiae bacterium]
MKAFFFGVLVGVLLALGAMWYFERGRGRAEIREVQDRAAAGVRQTVEALDAKLRAWHLSTPEIKAELAATGKVIRRSAREFGHAASSAASDAAITAKIKAKYLAEPGLSVWRISVNTTAGHVTLAGSVPSHDLIAKAIALALETEGVVDVTSNIQVRK